MRRKPRSFRIADLENLEDRVTMSHLGVSPAATTSKAALVSVPATTTAEATSYSKVGYAAAGSTLTITGTFDPSATTLVTYAPASGKAITIIPFAVTAETVVAAVPIALSFPGGSGVNATYKVSVQQAATTGALASTTAAFGKLHVIKAPPLKVAAGSFTSNVLAAESATIAAIASAYTTIGTAVSSSSTAGAAYVASTALIGQLTTLQADLATIEAGVTSIESGKVKQVVIGQSGGRAVVLNKSSLAVSDAILGAITSANKTPVGLTRSDTTTSATAAAVTALGTSLGLSSLSQVAAGTSGLGYAAGVTLVQSSNARGTGAAGVELAGLTLQLGSYLTETLGGNPVIGTLLGVPNPTDLSAASFAPYLPITALPFTKIAAAFTSTSPLGAALKSLGGDTTAAYTSTFVGSTAINPTILANLLPIEQALGLATAPATTLTLPLGDYIGSYSDAEFDANLNLVPTSGEVTLFVNSVSPVDSTTGLETVAGSLMFSGLSQGTLAASFADGTFNPSTGEVSVGDVATPTLQLDGTLAATATDPSSIVTLVENATINFEADPKGGLANSLQATGITLTLQVVEPLG